MVRCFVVAIVSAFLNHHLVVPVIFSLHFSQVCLFFVLPISVVKSSTFVTAVVIVAVAVAVAVVVAAVVSVVRHIALDLNIREHLLMLLLCGNCCCTDIGIYSSVCSIELFVTVFFCFCFAVFAGVVAVFSGSCVFAKAVLAST